MSSRTQRYLGRWNPRRRRQLGQHDQFIVYAWMILRSVIVSKRTWHIALPKSAKTNGD